MAWDVTPGNSPWKEFDRMRNRMERLLDAFFEGRPAKRVEGVREWVPSLDVSETRNDIVVKAEIPGIDPNDVDISLAGDTLTITGDKKQEEKEQDYHLLERNYGTFTRSIRVPGEVQRDKIRVK
jgi:HSP20 family protein